MADATRLVSPRLRGALADGTTFDVQTANPDLIRYERTAAKHKWPPFDQQPVTWLTFLAWAALKREAQLPPDVTWERFADELCLTVESLDDDTDEASPGDPTQPGPDPG